VLFRSLPFGKSLAYIPRGPLGEPRRWQALWPQVDALCRSQGAVFLKVEPDLWDPPAGPGHTPPQGFTASRHSIQPPRTIMLNLDGDEDDWLGRMKPKTRYNIRLAQKKGIQVHASQDIATYARLAKITAQRDGFGVHSLEYYRRAYELFHPKGECELLQAGYQGEPLAALMVFACGGRAWYFYGASSDQHREKMPTYLLQWEAMRWARQRGCLEYDLWGIPDEDEQTLEAGFEQRRDGLWGVYRFKRGFGGQLRRSAGPWDRVYQPVLYRLYLWWVQRRGS
jgi:peptidoglycan pentaglycine glycine transferase (the first glycine)